MHGLEQDAWSDLAADARRLVAIAGVEDRYARRIGATRENALQLDVEVAHDFAAGASGRGAEEVRAGERLRRGGELHPLALGRRRHVAVRGEIEKPPGTQPARQDEQREHRERRRGLDEEADCTLRAELHAGPRDGRAISNATAPSPRS